MYKETTLFRGGKIFKGDNTIHLYILGGDKKGVREHNLYWSYILKKQDKQNENVSA